MIAASYNVLLEPWITAEEPGSGKRELGLLDTLAEAHALSGLYDPSPLVECGLYRLLLALILDAFHLTNLEAIEGLFQAKVFGRTVLEAYVATVGRERFDLFDVEHPFLQSPAEVGRDDPVGPVVRLVQHLPSGTFATHFCHGGENEHAFSPAVCARGLAAIAPFMTSGGAGFSPSVNGMPPWYVLVRGGNLFETLVLNSAPLELFGDRDPMPPAWRRDGSVVPKEQRSCTSYLEALTWQPRRIRLLPEEGGVCTYTGEPTPVLVRRMVYTYGFRMSGEWTDPQVSYRYGPNGRRPLRPEEERGLWRDTGPLTLLHEADYEGDKGKFRFQRPYVVRQRQTLVSDGLIDRTQPLRIDAFGLRTDGHMKIFEWQHEELALPAEVLANTRAAAQLQAAMDYAERIEYQLGRALKKAYPRNGEGNEQALDTVIWRAKRGYWNALQRVFAAEYLVELGAQDPEDAAAPRALDARWDEQVRRLVRSTFDAAVDSLDADASALRRQVEARSYLWRVTAPRRHEEFKAETAANEREVVR